MLRLSLYLLWSNSIFFNITLFFTPLYCIGLIVTLTINIHTVTLTVKVAVESYVLKLSVVFKCSVSFTLLHFKLTEVARSTIIQYVYAASSSDKTHCLCVFLNIYLFADQMSSQRQERVHQKWWLFAPHFFNNLVAGWRLEFVRILKSWRTILLCAHVQTLECLSSSYLLASGFRCRHFSS